MKIQRHAGNPILKPEPLNPWESMAVCNPTVWYENGLFRMLYRAAGDDEAHRIYLGLAESRDGINFKRVSNDPVLAPSADGPDAGCIEDPRVVRFEGVFYITYAYRPFPPGRYWLHPEGMAYAPGSPEGAPRLIRENLTNTGLAMSTDLQTFIRLGRLTEANSDNRDVMFFPERIKGKYVLLHRKKELPDTPFPSIRISFMEDLFDYNDGFLLARNRYWWETKMGAGCPPLRTDDGWLLIYHAVCRKGIYRAGAMLLDLENPREVIARTAEPILEPKCNYECSGLYSDCVFPTGAVVVGDILYIYYGAADKCICLATCKLSRLIDHLLKRRRLMLFGASL